MSVQVNSYPDVPLYHEQTSATSTISPYVFSYTTDLHHHQVSPYTSRAHSPVYTWQQAHQPTVWSSYVVPVTMTPAVSGVNLASGVTVANKTPVNSYPSSVLADLQRASVASVTSGLGKMPKKRTTANKKERRRTLSINTAFASLRGCIPNVPSDTKLSKIKTLRLATSYIAYLMDVLSREDSSAKLTSFKADISRRTESKEHKKRREAEVSVERDVCHLIV